MIAVITTIFLISKNKKDSLVGDWTIDGVTNYEFDGKGKGKLKIPSEQFDFTYTIENNKLSIDFENENSIDVDYEYSFDNDTLVLKGLTQYIGEYKLTKQN